MSTFASLLPGASAIPVRFSSGHSVEFYSAQIRIAVAFVNIFVQITNAIEFRSS